MRRQNAFASGRGLRPGIDPGTWFSVSSGAFLGVLLTVALACSSAQAAAVPPVDEPPTWASLPAEQQAALSPLRRDWATLSDRQKERWIRVATRLPAMAVDERERVQQRMTQWARMSPDERSEARLRYQQSRQLSPQERKARWEAYQALSPEERNALAQRADDEAARPSAATPAAVAGKRNLVEPGTEHRAPMPVAPGVVQAVPGASTSPLSKPPPLPDHQQPGLPKIAAGQGFVEPNTLLPQRGPQAAAVKTRPAGERERERAR